MALVETQFTAVPVLGMIENGACFLLSACGTFLFAVMMPGPLPPVAEWPWPRPRFCTCHICQRCHPVDTLAEFHEC